MKEQQHIFTNKMLRTLLIPVIFEQVLNSLMGTVDTMMVSNVGSAAISAVSLVDSINVLVIQAFSALAAGGAILCSQYIGQKNHEMANKSARQVLFIITAISVAVTALCLLFRVPLLKLIFGKVEADVMTASQVYFFYTALSFPFIALYDAGASIFRSQGNTRGPMTVSVISNVINIGGNAALIWGFNMGVAGAAIATLASRVFCAVVVLWQLRMDRQPIVVRNYRQIRPDGKMIRRVLALGIPSGIENSMFQLGKIIVLSLVSTFGTYAIAANAVSNAIGLFQILPGMAITLAITPVISRCVGAGDYEQAKYYNKKLMLITYVSMTAMVLFIFSLLPFILNAYNLSDLTAKTTADIIHFHGIGAIFIWPVAFSLPATFRAAGDAKACMYISSISMWIFRIGFSYVLGKYMGMGVFGIWVAMVIDWVFRAMCFVIRYFKGSWKKNAIV